eukprot:1268115-Amphidinium_carterae.1
MAPAERPTRREAQRARLKGMHVSANHERSDALVDVFGEMYEANRIRWVSWEKYGRLVDEVAGVKTDRTFEIDLVTGTLKLKEANAELDIDLSTDILICFALQRRGVALDMSCVLPRQLHCAWLYELFDQRLKPAAHSRLRTSITQMKDADQLLFIKLAQGRARLVQLPSYSASRGAESAPMHQSASQPFTQQRQQGRKRNFHCTTHMSSTSAGVALPRLWAQTLIHHHRLYGELSSAVQRKGGQALSIALHAKRKGVLAPLTSFNLSQPSGWFLLRDAASSVNAPLVFVTPLLAMVRWAASPSQHSANVIVCGTGRLGYNGWESPAVVRIVAVSRRVFGAQRQWCSWQWSLLL